MPALKGNRNGSAAWFPSPEEPKIAITSKVPQSIVDRLNGLLDGQSRSAAIVEAIELLIKLRSKKVKAVK
jgi:hypothetical protein